MRRYRKKTVGFTMQMFPETESDIIDRLEERAVAGEPKTTYIKRLIREDIERNKPGQWIAIGNWLLSCSKCDEEIEDNDTGDYPAFCPNCGKRMKPGKIHLT